MPELPLDHIRLSRRQVLAAGGSLLAVLAFAPKMVLATPTEAKAKLAEWTGVDVFEKGRVHLSMPTYTERGSFVRIGITVDSPMTAADHVKEIHVVAERNTAPEVASFFLGPDAGRAEINTRIRLRRSQAIVVAALMNDGSVYMGKARVRVAKSGGGCG